MAMLSCMASSARTQSRACLLPLSVLLHVRRSCPSWMLPQVAPRPLMALMNASMRAGLRYCSSILEHSYWQLWHRLLGSIYKGQSPRSWYSCCGPLLSSQTSHCCLQWQLLWKLPMPRSSPCSLTLPPGIRCAFATAEWALAFTMRVSLSSCITTPAPAWVNNACAPMSQGADTRQNIGRDFVAHAACCHVWLMPPFQTVRTISATVDWSGEVPATALCRCRQGCTIWHR